MTAKRRGAGAAHEPPRADGPTSAASGGRGTIRDWLDLSDAERTRWLADFSPETGEKLLRDWRFWARPDQLPPGGDWVYWLILAGRGSGKTRAGAEAVREWVKDYPIVNLIGATADDARDIMVLGEAG